MFAATWQSARTSDLLIAINVASGGLVGRFVKCLTNKPYIVMAYAYEFLKYSESFPVRRFLRWVYSGASRIIAISRFTRESLHTFGVDLEKIEIAFPGAPTPQEYPESLLASIRDRFLIRTPHVILAVGRFVRRKGHAALLRAMPDILKRFPDAQLILVGDGPELEPCVRLAHQLNVRDHVLFPGALSDEEIAALYQLCELFALPTTVEPGGHAEGFGLVFVEAGSYGKPVVAGRSGGVEDAVIHNETGIIVDPDSPAEISEAVLHLMSNPDFAKKLGEKGKERATSELTWHNFAERILHVAGLT